MNKIPTAVGIFLFCKTDESILNIDILVSLSVRQNSRQSNEERIIEDNG